MAIVVEDGTGLPNAESYIDRSFLEDFSTSWGLGDVSDATDPDVEGALRRGTLLFDSVYGSRFTGEPVSSGQALLFPMSGLIDRRSFSLPVFPVQVKQATAVLAIHELNSPMSLFPSVTPSKVKKSITADKVSVEYDTTAGGAGYVAGARPILAMVENILSPILGVSTGSRALYGSAVRG